MANQSYSPWGKKLFIYLNFKQAPYSPKQLMPESIQGQVKQI